MKVLQSEKRIFYSNQAYFSDLRLSYLSTECNIVKLNTDLLTGCLDWQHSLCLLPGEVPVPLLLSVLLHDIAKPATRTVDPDGRIRFNGHDKLGAEMAEQILKRMRFSNDVVDDTKEMVLHHMRFMHVQDMRGATLRRFMARSTFPMELALHRVDCLGSNGELKNWEFLQTQLAEFTTKPVLPPRIVNGGDLLALGYPAGPLIGEILTAVQDRQLEGTLTDQEEALAWVRTQWALS